MATTRTSAHNGTSEHDAVVERADSIPAELQALRDALAAERVTFWPVAHSWFRLNDPDLAPGDHDAFNALYPQLLSASPRRAAGSSPPASAATSRSPPS